MNIKSKSTRGKIFFCFLVFFLVTGCTSHPNELLSSKKKNEFEVIEISNETASSIGLKTEVVEVKRVNFQLKFNGIVKEVPNKTFFIASPVSGRVLKVLVELNQKVFKGQKLAEISSQDVAELQFDVTKEEIDLEGDIEKAKLELDLAKNNYDREKKLYEDGITAKKDFLEADNRYRIASNNLEILEKKGKSVTELAEKRLAILGSHLNTSSNSGLVEIMSPGNGIIIKRSINPGEVVEQDKVLFEASDLSEVLLESKVYEQNLPEVDLGEKVTFTTEGYQGEGFNGEISYIAQVADPETRTIAVRAKMKNPEHKLKPEMFGKMLISIEEKDALVVSRQAVQKVDNEDIVYVKYKNGFREVKPKLGRETDGLIEVVSGIKPGEEIVTQGSFWLKSQLHTD